MPSNVERARDAALEHLKGSPAFVMAVSAHPGGASSAGRMLGGDIDSDDLVRMLATIAGATNVFVMDGLARVLEGNPPEARPALAALFSETLRAEKDHAERPGDEKRMFTQWRPGA